MVGSHHRLTAVEDLKVLLNITLEQSGRWGEILLSLWGGSHIKCLNERYINVPELPSICVPSRALTLFPQSVLSKKFQFSSCIGKLNTHKNMYWPCISYFENCQFIEVSVHLLNDCLVSLVLLFSVLVNSGCHPPTWSMARKDFLPFCRLFALVVWHTSPREMWTSVYAPQIENQWETRLQKPLKSNWLNQWVL